MQTAKTLRFRNDTVKRSPQHNVMRQADNEEYFEVLQAIWSEPNYNDLWGNKQCKESYGHIGRLVDRSTEIRKWTMYNQTVKGPYLRKPTLSITKDQ